MANSSTLNPYYRTTNATAVATEIKQGQTAYISTGKVTGDAYTPAMMEYDGSTGYYSKTAFTSAGNKGSAIVRFIVLPSTDNQKLIRVYDTYTRFSITVKESDHASVANKLQIYITDSGGTVVCNYSSSIDVTDGIEHTVLAAYDGDAGTASMYIDGIEVGDAVAPTHVLTTGTLETGNMACRVGSGVGGEYLNGEVGFVGYSETYLTNWSDFMDANGNPKALDETTWTEWGSQPLFWNPHGYMEDNRGSAGDMTKNGTIIVGDGGNR